MKTIQNNFKIFFLLCSFFSVVQVNAQVPQKMSYQAVVRNASNTLVTSAPVGIRVSILWGSATGSSFYTETQTLATNANGLVSFEIGTGSVVSGNFSTIDWSIGPFYIKTEIDPTGGTSYSITGTSQLLTVPYAFYAERSGDALAPAGNIGDMLYWDGTSWAVLSIGGSGKTLKVGATGVPTWTAVPSSPAGTNIGDMQYWNGTSWVTLPVGTPGQTLNLNASNVPIWSTGATGPQGPIGLTGATGPAGATGPQGPIGLTGANGTNAGVGGFTHYLGEEYLGGIIFYLYKGSDGLEHGLIVSLTESTAVWQTSSTLVNANREEDGAYNTALITGSPAATYIAGLGAGWYLPSIDELGLLYYNRYSVQKALRAGGNTLLSTSNYWSSTEINTTFAYIFYFNSGYADYDFKIDANPLRGVRAF